MDSRFFKDDEKYPLYFVSRKSINRRETIVNPEIATVECTPAHKNHRVE